MTFYPKARIYFGYQDSTSDTTANQNIWQAIPWPSTTMTEWRNSGDFTVTNDGGIKITYIGQNTSWFLIDAVCNVYKGTGGNANRNVEVQWHLNGSPAGPIRGSYMNAQDSVLLTGYGEMALSTNDTLVPMIRNIENNDKINMKNCSFSIRQDAPDF